MKQAMNWALLIIWLIIGAFILFVRKEVDKRDYACTWVVVIASLWALIMNT